MHYPPQRIGADKKNMRICPNIFSGETGEAVAVLQPPFSFHSSRIRIIPARYMKSEIAAIPAAAILKP